MSNVTPDTVPLLRPDSDSILNQSSLQCNDCHQCFIDSMSFQSHLPCSFVSISNSNKSTIQSSSLISISLLKPFTCNYCQKNFRRKSILKEHVRIHTDERPYICPHCSRSFRQNASLKAHLPSHQKQSFLCPKCKKSFNSKNNLKNHLLSHQEERERPFLCDYSECNKRFFQRGHLIQHQRIHKIEKKFLCEICQKGFHHRGNLNKHLQVHSRRNKIKRPIIPNNDYQNNLYISSYQTSNQQSSLSPLHSESIHNYHHVNNHHHITSLFTCLYCHQEFNSHSMLLNHSCILIPHL